MKKNVLIIGAGGVSHVAAHKCAQHNDVLGDICIASRRQHKCDGIIESIRHKGNIKDRNKRIWSRQIDATDIPAVTELIRETCSQIVVNLGSAYINMAVLDACIEAGVVYIDASACDQEGQPLDEPSWYAHYEWKRKEICSRKGITAILSAGFDPGVTNAYCAYAAKHHFDTLESIDILDVNAGNHGKFFATNFDPEINFREFARVFAWVNHRWIEEKIHSVKRVYDFPVVGKMPVYLTGHDEISSLPINMVVPTVRFWMGFSDHYINVFHILTRVGMTSVEPVRTAEGVEVVPLKVLKAVLPDPMSLAPDYQGKTCIGCLVRGKKDGRDGEVFLYNICDHEASYEETGSHAISYTAAVPVVAAALLVAQDIWDPRYMVNVEQLDPDPYLALLGRIGLPTECAPTVREIPVIE